MQEFNFKQKLLWEEGYMSGSKNIETQTGLVHAMRSNGPLHQVALYAHSMVQKSLQRMSKYWV